MENRLSVPIFTYEPNFLSNFSPLNGSRLSLKFVIFLASRLPFKTQFSEMGGNRCFSKIDQENICGHLVADTRPMSCVHCILFTLQFLFDHKSKFVKAHSTSGHKHALNEVLADPVRKSGRVLFCSYVRKPGFER